MDNTYCVQKVNNPHPIHARVPGSKSITNRALLLAAMAAGTTKLTGVLFSEDSRVFMQALKDLGFAVEISEKEQTVRIEGCGGKIPAADPNKEISAEVYVGSAGTAARFLTAFLGLSRGRYKLTCSEQMKKRPMEELLRSLEAIGSQITYLEEDYHFPFIIGFEGLKSKEVTINIDKSSQFLSALLIARPLLPEDFSIHIAGSHGMAYVRMTEQMIESFQPGIYAIEPDLSAAAYFYGAGAILGVPALVEGVFFDSLQGDIAFLKVLEKMGCSLEDCEEGICLHPPVDGLKGGRFDLSAFSDQALTLAAIAPFCKEAVEIQKISHIRLQESDRIAAILTNLSNLGIAAEETEDGVSIRPGICRGCHIQTYEDHRVAMAFSLIGLKTEGVVIENPACCRKTFENYFECLEEFVY